MKERGTLATIPMEIGYLYTFNTVFYLKKTYQGLKVSIVVCKLINYNCKGNIGRPVESAKIHPKPHRKTIVFVHFIFLVEY